MVHVMHVVAGAVLNSSRDKVLVATRPEGKPMAGSIEFPGGKMEPNETPEDALRRELKEELGLDVTHECTLTPITFSSNVYHDWEMKGKTVSVCIVVMLFVVEGVLSPPQAMEGQTFEWLTREEVQKPDRVAMMQKGDQPFVEPLATWWQSRYPQPP